MKKMGYLLVDSFFLKPLLKYYIAIPVPLSFSKVLNEAPCTISFKLAIVSYGGILLRDSSVQDVAYKVAPCFGQAGAFTRATLCKCFGSNLPLTPC